MKKIPLTQGFEALIDDSDHAQVSQFNWHAARRRGRVYAACRMGPGGSGIVFLHRFLIPGVPQVDHRDGNGLDNRRGNIRAATNQENQRGHRRNSKVASSIYRGVSWYPRYLKWRARVTVDNREVSLGYFSAEKDAAQAYDDAARKYFGEFASPNFPQPKTQNV